MAANHPSPTGGRRPCRRLTPVSLSRWCWFLVFAALAGGLPAAPKWAPVDPAELADPKPKVDPEAGAEILLREADVDQSQGFETEERHHVRAKIFTERGLTEFAKVDLPYEQGSEIIDVAARTIKPDGTVIELGKKDVFDREIVKAGNVRLKVKSFAPPGIVPGAIVEYRYTAITSGVAMFFPIQFQGDLPVRLARCRLRAPQFRNDVTIHSISFNCTPTPLKTDRDGYYHFEMSNLPAAKLEPFQVPAINTRTTILVYYSGAEAMRAAVFWKTLSKELYENLESEAKVTKSIRAALDGIVAPKDSIGTKLQKIFDYCRTKIVNRDRDAHRFTAEQRRKFKANEKAADTLKNGSGTSHDINVLFAALVRAAGIDARWAACNDRNFMLFDEKIGEPFLLPDWVVAVDRGNEWYYCDPGATYLPFGTVPWSNTDTAALLAEPEGTDKMITVPGGPPDSSVRSRNAELRLDAEGTLEGDVTEQYTGQWGASLKYTLDGKTDAEREEYIRNEFQEHQKLAEVTAVKVANATDPLADLQIAYHLRIPEYADRTGTRLFFQPSALQKGVPPVFEAATRRSVILFPYRSTEQDEIRLVMPEGYTLEEPAAPEGLEMGKLGDYTVQILFQKSRRELTYKRKLTLAGLAFPVTTYPAIKRAFEIIHERDNHLLTLRKDAEEPAAPAAENPPATDQPPTASAPPTTDPAPQSGNAPTPVQPPTVQPPAADTSGASN